MRQGFPWSLANIPAIPKCPGKARLQPEKPDQVRSVTRTGRAAQHGSKSPMGFEPLVTHGRALWNAPERPGNASCGVSLGAVSSRPSAPDPSSLVQHRGARRTRSSALSATRRRSRSTSPYWPCGAGRRACCPTDPGDRRDTFFPCRPPGRRAGPRRSSRRSPRQQHATRPRASDR
jgi:hypothetical protein